MSENTLLTTKEAAKKLGVSVRRVQALINNNQINAEKIGRDYVIRATDLQNVKKLKRGRPSMLPSELEKFYWSEPGNSATRRTMRNYYFLYEALNLLVESGIEQYKFLYDNAKDLKRQGNGHFKKTILSELGRIKDKNLLLEAASKICEAQPKTATAVKWIREIRKAYDTSD